MGKLVSLQHLGLSGNLLQGSIPKEIGQLVNLQVLFLNGNRLTGSIPVELFNCVQLTTLDLGSNQLSGLIPRQIGRLQNLECLVLSHNRLTGPIPSEICEGFQQSYIPTSSYLQHHGYFDLSWNFLTGSVPQSIGDCIVMVEMYLNHNNISGSIPIQLARLTNLTNIDLSMNQIGGSLPEQLGELHRLQGLNLAYNQLSGHIPPALGDLRSIVLMNLSRNSISGPLPVEFGKLEALQDLDLSWNTLSGRIPTEWTQLNGIIRLNLQGNGLNGDLVFLTHEQPIWQQLGTLNLSHNFLSGYIPDVIGNLSALTALDLHGNDFDGPIPDSLGDISQLQYLDLSQNHLTGPIPLNVCRLELNYLDASNNKLVGIIPDVQACINGSFGGNVGLCYALVNGECHAQSSVSLLNTGAILGITIGSSIAVLCLMLVLVRWKILKQDIMVDNFVDEKKKLHHPFEPNMLVLARKIQKEPLSINIAMFERPLLRLTLADILRITNNFSKANIIGNGGFGTVYKALLPDGRTVAIKKLGPAGLQGNREFLAEMETLGKVKHKNLVPLLGYCSFGDEKLLVYDYMANGSLDIWLRNRADAVEVLDWAKRFKIASGAARGLAFLHHGFIPHIIHRDIKASNILLDSDFEPKVADFGLARLISACETHISTDIAGTFGYIPPEYGHTWRSTTKGDVYSYGVILLEILTGKEPTGTDFKEVEGGNLVGWVRQKISQNRLSDILDPAVVCHRGWKVMLMQVLQVATLCTSDDPHRRPTMLEVVKYLKEIENFP
ncbi:hypothetical protein KP509_26G011700 [Ceratopteris richardii]|nr:hypothetical protein KP509_26G011700 [Ceratopteris richardii]